MRSLLVCLTGLTGFASSCNFSGSCTKSNIANEGCNEINNFSDSEVELACSAAAIKFSEISQKNFQGDNNFLDGVGSLNEDAESETPLKVDAGRMMRFQANAASNNRILWPQYDVSEDDDLQTIDNFESCDLRAAVCCYTKMRDDGGFSIGVPLNANVCDIDFGNSPHSSRVYNGFGPLQASSAYCVGMTWGADENDIYNNYKGNMLYDISFATFLSDHVTSSISGSPMCGCIEHMPRISTAACRRIDVSGNYNVDTNGGVLTITPTSSLSVSYVDCGMDLKSHYNMINSNPVDQAALAKRIVDKCDTDSYLNDELFVRDTNTISDRYNRVPEVVNEGWTHFAGLGSWYYPTKTWDMDERESDFRQLLGSGPTYPLIYRHCPSCIASHQHIFLKRLTPIPDGLNYFYTLTNYWKTGNGNTINVDYRLYSTLQDARLDQNPWEYCEEDWDEDGMGFPMTCGPTGYVPCQHNSYDWTCHNNYNGKSHGFFIEP